MAEQKGTSRREFLKQSAIAGCGALAASQLDAARALIGRAGYFGDENDPESLIAKVKKASTIQLLKARSGTAPRVYYVANEKLEVIYG